MNLPTQPYKGARDFYPEDKRLQKHIFNILRDTVEKYGYEEYDAPILELLELFKAKTSDEIVSQQSYTFTDRGGREVTIRPEMTPSVSRMVARKRNQLTYPLRWYSIPNLWRYERPQKSRFREHWQLNVDLFGEESIDAEVEIIQIADNIFTALGAKRDMYEMRLSSRKFSDYLLSSYIDLNKEGVTKITKILDKKDKTEPKDFDLMLNEVMTNEQKSKLNKALEAKNVDELDKNLRESEPLKKLTDLTKELKSLGITNVVFSPSLVRGFNYYTDIVFEIYDKHPDNNRSMMGGGRYDGLVGMFGVEEVPTIGFGLGDATLLNFLNLHKLTPLLEPETKLAILTVGDVFNECQKVLANLRGAGINTAVNFSDRKVAAKIKWALSKSIPYVLVMGEQEVKNNLFKLKHLESGKEDAVDLTQLIKVLK